MAILRLNDGAYGMSIQEELETTAKRMTSFGALYTTLDRLEDKGYLTSAIGEATPERGGRAKRYFKVTAVGVAAVKQYYRATQRMAKGLEPLLGGA